MRNVPTCAVAAATLLVVRTVALTMLPRSGVCDETLMATIRIGSAGAANGMPCGSPFWVNSTAASR